MQKVAFFDIDGTVFRSSLLIELVLALVREGVFHKEVLSEFSASRNAWTNREGTYETYIADVVRAFLVHIQGVHYGEFADVGKRVVHEQSKFVYRYTRDLICDLKGKDYRIIAISQSPKTILDEFCASYGFDKVYGRIYEIGPMDRFTGKVTGEDLIADKAAIVDRVVGRGGYSLEHSIGVGDTESDIPLLLKVDMPICFNPNMKLYEHAKAAHWPIVVERKDVVYTISE